jgi:hypothetical protein
MIKTMTYACGLVAAFVVLGGCASMQAKTTMTQSVPGSHPTIDTDYAYVAQVERQARLRNVGIQWVNPPSRHLSPSAEQH